MAKWGEGDPRWIVEERPDATNVNNWHWVERNATMWSKDKLRKLFEGFHIEDENVSCVVTEVSKLEGEAVANNRKGKLIFFYEWEIEASWEGKLKSGEENVKGTIEIPNLSEEHSPEDVDVNVSTKDTIEEAYIVKEFLRVYGTPKIRLQLDNYLRSLKEEFGQGAILPTKVTDNKTQLTPMQRVEASDLKEKFNKTSVACKYSSTSHKQTKILNLTEDFKCSGSDLYRALTVQEMVQAYSGHESTMECTVGGKFSLFGGNISGHFTELIPEKKIASKWKFKSWPDDHYSDLLITITEEDGSAKLVLHQKNIPERDYEKTLEGWKQNYFGRIRTVFGFGARIF